MARTSGSAGVMSSHAANPAKPAPSAFELAVRRCRAATQSLEGLGALEPAQKMQLAAILLDIREKAQAMGVPLLSW